MTPIRPLTDRQRQAFPLWDHLIAICKAHEAVLAEQTAEAACVRDSLMRDVVAEFDRLLSPS